MKKVYSIRNSKLETKNHIIFICDHATNNFLERKRDKFLTSKIINSHVAYDIGAKELTISITKKLKQSYILSNFSRLLIDPNRMKSDKELIVQKTFDIDIPFNVMISKNEKESRIKDFYTVYHSKIRDLIKTKKKKYNKIFLISIHSFTKKSKKFNRGIEVGLLWNKNMNLLLHIQSRLLECGVHYGRNYPYSGFHFNYTLDKHSQNGLLDNIAIEIRNDLINNKKGIKKYTEIFSQIFKELING